MARQSSSGGGRSSNSHGYWVTSPVATDQRNSADGSQPQRTPSFPVKAIWPLDHTGGPDGYNRRESLGLKKGPDDEGKATYDGGEKSSIEGSGRQEADSGGVPGEEYLGGDLPPVAEVGPQNNANHRQ